MVASEGSRQSLRSGPVFLCWGKTAITYSLGERFFLPILKFLLLECLHNTTCLWGCRGLA